MDSVLPPAAGVQAATLTNGGNTHIWIQSLDGQRLGVPSHGRYQLAPGRHVIRVQYSWTRGSLEWKGNDMADYAFEARAGASLRIVCEHAEEPAPNPVASPKGTWTFWIEDASSREVVATPEGLPIPTRGATGVWLDPLIQFW